MISRLSVRLSSIADNGGLGGGVAGRCRQIRIWLHRAGRARSQKREMKFDRSDRDPLAFGSSILVSKLPTAPSISGYLALLVIRSQPRELQNGVGTLIPRVSAPLGCPTGTDGHHRPSRTLYPLSPSLLPALSRDAPHFIRFSFICYLPAAAATAAAGCSLGGIR